MNNDVLGLIKLAQLFEKLAAFSPALSWYDEIRTKLREIPNSGSLYRTLTHMWFLYRKFIQSENRKLQKEIAPVVAILRKRIMRSPNGLIHKMFPYPEDAEKRNELLTEFTEFMRQIYDNMDANFEKRRTKKAPTGDFFTYEEFVNQQAKENTPDIIPTGRGSYRQVGDVPVDYELMSGLTKGYAQKPAQKPMEEMTLEELVKSQEEDKAKDSYNTTN